MDKNPLSDIPVALTIAGFDPSGAAGILADVRTFNALGVYPYAIPTCLTVQNFDSVTRIDPVPLAYLTDSLQALQEHKIIRSVKLGLIPGKSVYEILIPFLKKTTGIPVVCDPIISSSSGYPFLKNDDLEFLKEKIFPLINLLTPNLPELEILSGISISSSSDILRACETLQSWGDFYILVKGGHASGSKSVTDYLFHPKKRTLVPFQSGRVKSRNLRGTGCTLSAAICAGLAKGLILEEAILNAKEYLEEVILKSKDLNWNAKTGPLWPF